MASSAAGAAAASGAGARIRRQNQLIRGFREAGAVSPDSAFTPQELGLRHLREFDHLVRFGVFVPTAEGRYFLDEDAVKEFLNRRRSRILIALVIFVLVLIAVLISSIR